MNTFVVQIVLCLWALGGTIGEVQITPDVRFTGSGNQTVRLTEAVQSRAGAAWITEKMGIYAGGNLIISGFTLRFLFRSSSQDNPPADGMAVVLQNIGGLALGGNGGNMGVPDGTQRSGFKFDWWNLDGGTGVRIATFAGATLVKNVYQRDYDQWSTFDVTYEHFAGLVTVTINGNPFNFSMNMFPSNMEEAWVGVTAATGGSVQEHSISRNISYTVSTVGITTNFLTTSPLTTQSPTTKSLTTKPLTTKQTVTTKPLTTQAMTTKPLTTQEMTTKPLTTKLITTQPLTTQPLTTQPLTTQSLTTQPLTTKPLTTMPLTTAEMTTQPLTTQPLTTAEMTTQPLTTAELTTSPLTTKQITSGVFGEITSSEDSSVIDDSSSSKNDGNRSGLIGGIVGALIVVIGCTVAVVLLAIVYRKRRGKRMDKRRVTSHKSVELILWEEQREKVLLHARNSLERLLLSSFPLTIALCKFTASTESDKVAKSLVHIFENHKKTVELIRRNIKAEVKATNHSGSLLRNNSMASKLMKAYSQIIGKAFLRHLLGDLVQEICDRPKENGISFEIDPNKLSPQESLDKNRERLQNTCSKFLRRIFDSADTFPLEFRQICNHLQNIVTQKFPESAQICIGGFLFLRFLCAAIVVPHTNGLSKAPPNEYSQRALVLIAKALQNVSNNVTFDNKEQYMTCLNEFVSQNFSSCQDFFDEMATIPPNALPAQQVHISNEDRTIALNIIHQQLIRTSPKIKEKHERKEWFAKLQNVLNEFAEAEKEGRENSMESQSNMNRDSNGELLPSV